MVKRYVKLHVYVKVFKHMKTNRFFAAMATLALFGSASAIVPKIEKPLRYMKITDVERTDSNLRVGVTLQHRPNFWVRVPSSTRIIDASDTTRQFKIMGAENFSLDEKVWMPGTGHYEGTLIFEKLPEDVKVVDFVESDIKDSNNNMMGIHLDETSQRITPKLIAVEDILNNPHSLAEKWSGLDPKRYRDLSFYDKNGKTVVKGKVLDYYPKYGGSTFSIRTKDDFTGNEKVNVGNINSDGSFEIELPITYPQFDYFELGDIHRFLFLIPGDTLSIATTTFSGIDPEWGYVPEYFGYEGVVDDGVTVNLLTDSLLNKRYPLTSLYKNYSVARTDSMKTETYKSNERLGSLLDSVVADLPVLLSDLPISNYSKDLLSAIAIGKICEMMEDLDMDFRFEKGPGYKKDNDGNYTYQEGEILDFKRYIAPRIKHKDLTYNNPLLMCNGLVLPNRWTHNNLFHSVANAGIGFEKIPGTAVSTSSEDILETFRIADNYLDSIGVGNCFVAQLVRTSYFIDQIKKVELPSYTSLEKYNSLISPIIQRNESQRMNEILMAEYCNLVKDALIAEDALSDDSAKILDGTPEGELLKKIISPYKGNVLFLDFWGIGCGPCRSGMTSQKTLLEELADKPFKVLYIAEDDGHVDEHKKWLSDEDIKGEHIFVSKDDWKRLCGLFTISGIPHGVLIGKNGNIIDPDYHLYKEEMQLKKALEK